MSRFVLRFVLPVRTSGSHFRFALPVRTSGSYFQRSFRNPFGLAKSKPWPPETKDLPLCPTAAQNGTTDPERHHPIPNGACLKSCIFISGQWAPLSDESGWSGLDLSSVHTCSRNTRKIGTAAEAVSVASTWTEVTLQREPFRAMTEFCFGIGVFPSRSNSTSSASILPS